MGRVLVLAVVLGVMPSVAAAGPKKKVMIETKPPGASVYLNLVEDGEVCKTPCPIEVDPDTTVIVDLLGHKPVVDQIVINRKEKPPYKRNFTLVATLGKIVVEGPRGAVVTVDDEDKGKAPVEIEITAGTHAVVLTLNGKQVYAQPVEVAANEDVKVAGSAPKAVAVADPDDKPVIDPGDTKPEIRQPAKPVAPRAGRYVALSAAFGVGFRDFDYKNADTDVDPNLNPENERGQMLAGLVGEVWPGTLIGVRFLRGFALVLRFQLGVNEQVVKTDTDMDTDAKTFWRSFEASARQRWVIGDTASIDVGAGYVRDQHQFTGNQADIAKVPDADYQSVRVGARAALLLGSVEPYAAFENRIVLSGGPLEKRFMEGVSVNGLRAAVGLGANFGNVAARLEGSITRYTWKINNAPVSGTDGALDSIKLVSFVLGYSY